MDQTTYTQLSGRAVTDVARFEALSELAQAKLEGMLGWPLDPNDWDNQYIENGIALNECSCPSADAELDNPDEVVNAYRIFRFRPSDVYIAIDPATAIHAVKLVINNVTYRKFDADDYRLQWQNGKIPFTRYLTTLAQCACFCQCNHWTRDYTYQVAVDADWAFDELPAELNQLYSDLITETLDLNSNIKSESITSHSYTKFDKADIIDKYSSVFNKYVGPNGWAKREVN